MDAVEFIKERDRMCKSYYDAEKRHCADECPAHDVQCTNLDNLSTDAEELVARVEKWSAAHPRKTRQSVFLEQWPNAERDKYGTITICPKAIIGNAPSNDGCGCACSCADCRREFWMQEVE